MLLAEIYAQSGNWMLNGPENKGDIVVSDTDRKILREYAKKLAELAHRPLEEEKARLWAMHNDLQQTRPLFFCDPENGWNEILRPESFQCTGALAKTWEAYLRKEIIWGEQIRDDRVLEATLYLPWVHHSPAMWGVDLEMHQSEQANGSYNWTPVISDFEKDMAKLRFPSIEVDAQASRLLMELGRDVFDGILDVKRRHKWWHAQTLTRDYAELRGLETMLFDFYDYPDEMHRLMGFLRDGYLHMIDYLEEHGLLSLNTGSAYVGSGGFGFTNQLPAEEFNPDHVRTIDMWNFLESQETNTVSPEFFAEFILPYQISLAERFGLGCYGCCEPLDTRWEYVKTIPRLRRVSVSAWADVNKMAQNLGEDYVYSYKPSPSPLSSRQFNAEDHRMFFRDFLQRTAGRYSNHVEIIMKDNHTLAGRPENLYSWATMIREEINRFWS